MIAATLASNAKAGHDLIVWCRACKHQVTYNPDVMVRLAEQYGAETTLIDWCRRLVCSKCGSRDIDSVVSGYRPVNKRPEWKS